MHFKDITIFPNNNFGTNAEQFMRA